MQTTVALGGSRFRLTRTGRLYFGSRYIILTAEQRDEAATFFAYDDVFALKKLFDRGSR